MPVCLLLLLRVVVEHVLQLQHLVAGLAVPGGPVFVQQFLNLLPGLPVKVALFAVKALIIGKLCLGLQIGEDAVKLVLQRLEFLPGGSAAIGRS